MTRVVRFDGKHCTFLLGRNYEPLTNKELAALYRLSVSKKEGCEHLCVFLGRSSDMLELHPMYLKLIEQFFVVSGSVVISFKYFGETKYSRNLMEFFESLFALVGSGKTKLEGIEFWDGSEGATERKTSIFDQFQTGIRNMVADSRSSLRVICIAGDVNHLTVAECDIAKAVLRRESRFERLCLWSVEGEEYQDHRLYESALVEAAVLKRKMRATAVLVCCVLRACDGAPHFMDVILQIAAFVGVLQ